MQITLFYVKKLIYVAQGDGKDKNDPSQRLDYIEKKFTPESDVMAYFKAPEGEETNPYVLLHPTKYQQMNPALYAKHKATAKESRRLLKEKLQ